MIKDKESVMALFDRLKSAHPIFIKASFDKQQEILSAFDNTFSRLDLLGVPRSFSESLLIFGKEFVDSFKPPLPATPEVAQAIFGGTIVSRDDKGEREFQLAENGGVLIYRSLPMVAGKVKIQSLDRKAKVVV